MFLTVVACAALVLLSFSALFSASETALFSIPRERLWRYEQSRSRVDGWVFRLLANGQRTLLLILLGNTFVNITLVGLIHTLIAYTGARHSALMTLLVATGVILLFGEMVPKNIALRNNELAARLIAPVLYHLSLALRPLLHLIQGLNRFFLVRVGERLRHPSPYITLEELESALETCHNQNVIQAHEYDIIASILRRGSQPVRRFALHRSQLVTVHPDTHCADALKQMRRNGRPFAVVRVRHQRTLPGGVIRASAVLARGSSEAVERSVVALEWIPGSMDAAEVVSHMVQERLEQVGILDEFGGFDGIFSLTPGLESLLALVDRSGASGSGPWGELGREFNGLEHLEAFHGWLPPALLKEASEVSTLNGFIGNYLGRIPHTGESFAAGGVSFYIVDATPTVVKRVRIMKRGRGDGR